MRMRPAYTSSGLGLLLFVAACSSNGAAERHDDLEPEGGVDSQQPEGSTSADAASPEDSTGIDAAPREGSTNTDAAPDPPVCGGVWKSTSTRIAVSSFGFWQGSMRFEKDAAALSSEQREALQNLCVIDAPVLRGADFVSYSITVYDSDGTSIRYRAAQNDVLDGDEGATGGIPSISYASLLPFLATFDCSTAMSAGGTGSPPADGGVPDSASIPTLSPDSGCYNGVFVGYGNGKSWVGVPVQQAGTLRLETVGCFERIALRLYSPTGGEELASTALQTAPDCPSLEYRVDAAGTYVLSIEKRNVDDAAQGKAGDMYVHATVTP